MGPALSSLLSLAVVGGLVFAVVSGFRSVASSRSDAAPIDPAEAGKSFVLHVGLFLALLACSVGLIDLLQALVDESDRLAGSNSDLARGLSLLIIGSPVFALVLRAIAGRRRDRAAAGDDRPHRGWSVYLVAALTTTLIATLTSVAQIANDVSDVRSGVEGAEVVQLIVWFGVWLGHWFGLRPRFGVRGDAHLAIGSIVGLSWMASGVAAVVFDILAAGYDAAFDPTLARSVDVSFWMIIAVVGAIVWSWHWLGHFNSDPGGRVSVCNAVEGDRRQSPLWFFTVVVAGVLPGLVAMVVAITSMISGLLIWFFGTTDQSAAEYFDPVSGLVAALAVGLVTWAYHRWLLQRRHRTARNESLRFHDYAVASLALIGMVSATAALVAVMFDVVSIGTIFAGSLAIGNGAIVACTVLAASSIVWWRTWAGIEVQRAADPLGESDSVWRKFSLIGAFGLGGLALGISGIWIVFSLLRDLLDTQLGRSTVDDLSGPVGWAIAVAGAVWYHWGVWRVDRALLATRVPPPPPPPSASPPPLQPPSSSAPVEPAGVRLRAATALDLGELVTLTLAERGAATLTDEGPPPATYASIAELTQRLVGATISVAVDGGRIVGFVMTDGPEGSARRPMVAPDRRNEGISELLLGRPD